MSVLAEADRFPVCVPESDHGELEFWCPVELAEWRTAKDAHFAARAVGGTQWAELAAAFDRLRVAYAKALAYAETQDAAVASGDRESAA